MDNQATIKENGGQFELWIGGVLKAYSQTDHEAGRKELIKMAEEKGYIVILEGDE
jgi:hypothetical protein